MLADKACSVCIGVYAVARIVAGLRLSLKCLVEKLVERDICVSILVCELSYDGEKTRKVVSYLCFIGAIEKEGSKDNYLCVGIFLEAFEYAAVIELDLLVGGGDHIPIVSVPEVIDTDKYRDNVGLECDSVGIESVEELTCAVSAYAEIDELKLKLGVSFFYERCGIGRISVAEVVIVSSVSACIGDAVTLK